MNHIFEKANDVHVRSTLVYVKSADEYAYADAAKTVKISAVDLKDIFEKGMIIVDGTKEYSPVSFSLDATVGTVTYVKTNGTTQTTADLATLVSVEHV